MNVPRFVVVNTVLSLLIGCLCGSAQALQFDFIYIDNMDIVYTKNLAGMSSGGESFGFLVNTGTENLTSDDINNLYFTSTSSVSGFSLTPIVSSQYGGGGYTLASLAPVLPGDAIGTVNTPSAESDILLDLIAQGETFRNFSPTVSFYYLLSKTDNSTFEGDAYFDITLAMLRDDGLQDEVSFQIHANMQLGDTNSINWTSGARSSSVTAPFTPLPPAVPEPISSILFVTGGILLAGRRYLRRKRLLE